MRACGFINIRIPFLDLSRHHQMMSVVMGDAFKGIYQLPSSYIFVIVHNGNVIK